MKRNNDGSRSRTRAIQTKTMQKKYGYAICGEMYSAGRLHGRVCRKVAGHVGRHAETTSELN